MGMRNQKESFESITDYHQGALARQGTKGIGRAVDEWAGHLGQLSTTWLAGY